MGRLATILSNVRIPLNDRSKERWSDSDLLLFASKAQKDITKECNILKDTLILPLSMGQAIYTLDEDTVEILECRFNNNPLKMKTTEEMDKLLVTGQLVVNSTTVKSSNWETATTDNEPTVVVYNKLRRRRIRIWPTVIGTELTISDTDLDTAYGIVTEVDEFTMIGEFGFAGTVFDTDAGVPSYENGAFGILSEIVDQTSVLIHRSKLSLDLTTLDDELQIDINCDEAIEHFVIAKAFSNDMIEENRTKAAEHLTWYNREITRIKDNVSINIAVNENRETQYNGMGD